MLLVIFAIYLLVSVITFIVYGWDKYRATRSAWRVPENTLHLLELLCGWPGAFLAQRVFHHKWKKTAYMFTFWCIVAIHVLLWGLWIARLLAARSA
jgi:uncharacterized membrane protein YsdA (DUF1294 family)